MPVRLNLIAYVSNTLHLSRQDVNTLRCRKRLDVIISPAQHVCLTTRRSFEQKVIVDIDIAVTHPVGAKLDTDRVCFACQNNRIAEIVPCQCGVFGWCEKCEENFVALLQIRSVSSRQRVRNVLSSVFAAISL